MFDVIGMITAGLKVAGQAMARVWGEQTSAEASLQQRSEEAARKKHEALAMLKAANAQGDPHAITLALSAVNGWDTVLRRLHAEAAASSK